MSKAAELANLIGNINAGGGGVNRNLIINGAMNVAQRGTSSTGIGASSGYFTCDRWKITAANTAGRLTMTQDSSAPDGFANSIKLDCTTADTSIAAGELLILEQRIEGQNLQTFKKGTSSALPMTISFYVKGNASATYAVQLLDKDNDRTFAKTFSVTTDWSRVSLTFAGDTTGAFTDDNGESLRLNIWLHAGSTYSGGTQTTGWVAESGNLDNLAVGITSFFDSTDRTFFITGVQLEVGQNPTEFEHEPFERTMAKCQRYFEIYNGTVYFFDINDPAVAQSMHMGFTVKKRAAPSVTLGTGSGFDSLYARTDHDQTQGVCITGSHSSNAQATIASPSWQADAEL